MGGGGSCWAAFVDLDPVKTLGVFTEKGAPFSIREICRYLGEGAKESVIVAVEPVDREVAGEHAPIDAEDLDGRLSHDRGHMGVTGCAAWETSVTHQGNFRRART